MAKPASPAPTRAPGARTAAARAPARRAVTQRPKTQRADGWTPERRAAFLEALAEGHTVEAACASVGLSVASTYALRHREGAEAFALGWRAACLLARDRLADILTSRAIDGQVDTYTRADGTAITRHRHDNRLALSLLARLDRLAEAPADAAEPSPAPANRARPRRGVTHRDSLGSAGGFAGPSHKAASPAYPAAAFPPAPPPEPQTPEAARLAASAFPALLALVAQDADADAVALRAYVEAQYARSLPQLPQLRRYRKGQEWLADLPHCEQEIGMMEVWQDDADGEMLTLFAPPPGFAGTEYGTYGEPAYARTLTPREAEEWDPRIDVVRLGDGADDASA
jgi:hypothetical protein